MHFFKNDLLTNVLDYLVSTCISIYLNFLRYNIVLLSNVFYEYRFKMELIRIISILVCLFVALQVYALRWEDIMRTFGFSAHAADLVIS